jgi:predicted Zn-dependent protease
MAGLAAGCFVATTVFAQAGAPATAPVAAPAPAIVAPAAGIDPALLRRASDFTYQQEVATLRNENRIDAGTSYPAYARRLAAPILAIAGKPPYDLRDGSWAITIEKSPDLVFWSLPGGNVVMSSAFFEGGKFSAGELAALFAHAYAHEIGGHDRTEAAARLAAHPDAASADPNRRLVALSEILVAIAKRNPFQIGQERQADTVALDLLARSGYDPRSLVMLMKKLQVSAPARGPGGFVTMHPGWPERVAEVEAQLEGPTALYEQYKAAHSGKPSTASTRPQQQMRQPGKPQKPQRPPQKGAPRSTPSQLGVPASPKPAPPVSAEPAPAQPATPAESQPAAPAPAQPSAPATPPS